MSMICQSRTAPNAPVSRTRIEVPSSKWREGRGCPPGGGSGRVLDDHAALVAGRVATGGGDVRRDTEVADPGPCAGQVLLQPVLRLAGDQRHLHTGRGTDHADVARR